MALASIEGYYKMATETKEKLIRVLQLMQTTDEKTPMNATQIVEKLSTEYELEGVDRRSIYRDIALLQDCGYDIVQTTDKRSGWYMNTHAFADWQIKIMMDAVQQARCVSINEAMQIRENLLNLTSKRGRSRFSHMMMPHSGNVKNVQKYQDLLLQRCQKCLAFCKKSFSIPEKNRRRANITTINAKPEMAYRHTIYPLITPPP